MADVYIDPTKFETGGKETFGFTICDEFASDYHRDDHVELPKCNLEVIDLVIENGTNTVQQILKRAVDNQADVWIGRSGRWVDWRDIKRLLKEHGWV